MAHVEKKRKLNAGHAESKIEDDGYKFPVRVSQSV